ncbi:hypothetical protein RISK_006475 [Rhodopirellula islandica]|uniref:Uncharacterized protein n=1 Tax=Rhodopirellula islandica TaxID=595434 RepID=A0A0J1E783_RHOIS|nr:hypothetical protein RISK_006475 [Rhodopirellula islandica]
MAAPQHCDAAVQGSMNRDDSATPKRPGSRTIETVVSDQG